MPRQICGEPIRLTDEEKHTICFRIYLNYFNTISNFLDINKGNPKLLLEGIIKTRNFRNIKSTHCKDITALGKYIRNTWFTEIQTYIPLKLGNYISYSNHWLLVKTYYAIYHALRAYFIASRQDVGIGHKSNLHAMGEEIKRRPDLFPYPWKVICIGHPKNPEYLNIPSNISPKSVSPLSSNPPFWNSYTMFLKTTRRRYFEEWQNIYKKQSMHSKEKKQEFLADKKHFLKNLSPTTLFDCLYRLRLRSNYVDADIFLQSEKKFLDPFKFDFAVKNINWWSLLVLEFLIARYIGKNTYKQVVDDFQKYEQLGLSSELISRRWEIINNLI
jgi:hypothetical protein